MMNNDTKHNDGEGYRPSHYQKFQKSISSFKRMNKQEDKKSYSLQLLNNRVCSM